LPSVDSFWFFSFIDYIPYEFIVPATTKLKLIAP